MNVYLIGYRGTGKTSLGRAIAIQLKKDFVDTDDLIVEKSGMNIPEIFSLQGEEVFRDIESGILKEISERKDLIVSTGGGIIEKEENRRLIKKTGHCIYLKADTDTIFSRISEDKNRPALTTSTGKDEIKVMLDKRNHWYEELAQLTLDTAQFKISECVDMILDFLKRQGA